MSDLLDCKKHSKIWEYTHQYHMKARDMIMLWKLHITTVRKESNIMGEDMDMVIRMIHINMCHLMKLKIQIQNILMKIHKIIGKRKINQTSRLM